MNCIANSFRILLFTLLWHTSFSYGQSSATDATTSGAACVIAKQLGNSIAIEWALGEPSVDQAIKRAKQALHARGYEHVFPQAGSSDAHGWMVIIQTRYQTYTGRERTSYGCGFSAQSSAMAEANAQKNLRAYSWGWKERMGYQVIENLKY